MTGFHPQNGTPRVREIPRQQPYIWLSSVNKLDFRRFSGILLVATHEELALLACSPDEGSIMQLVEQHRIDKKDPRYAMIDEAAFKSKNLYNAANYKLRQAFIHEGKYLNYHEMQRRMQSHEEYKALPAKVSQQILMVLDRNWISFFEALKAYKEDPSKFLGRPKLPKYKHKQEGRNILVYTVQAISKKGLKRGLIQPSMLAISIRTVIRSLYVTDRAIVRSPPLAENE